MVDPSLPTLRLEPPQCRYCESPCISDTPTRHAARSRLEHFDTPCVAGLDLPRHQRKTLQKMEIRASQCKVRVVRIAEHGKRREIFSRQVGAQSLAPRFAEDGL